MYITPLFLNIMENESFERAKAIKEEIEKCNSLLESILKSSRITLHDERGQELYFDVERDYGKENLSMTLTGRPENLKEHHGINIVMAEMFLDGFKAHQSHS